MTKKKKKDDTKFFVCDPQCPDPIEEFDTLEEALGHINEEILKDRSDEPDVDDLYIIEGKVVPIYYETHIKAALC